MSDEHDRAPDSDAPPTEEEVTASQKLRDALDEDPIASALKAAWSPEPITAAAHQQIVDDVPTAEELELAARVEDDPVIAALKAAWSPEPITAEAHRQILEDLPTADELKLASLVDEDEMVAALRAAWNPAALDAKEHQRIIDRALAGAVVTLQTRPRLRVAVVTTTTIFALAAGVVLFLQTQDTAPKSRPEVALTKARSTQPLFDEPFHAGETSARIDKIAMARASDYRNNYFAKRGVK
ncbi:MAG: hypothetical protein U0270_08365 [Labilithrix sp.]